ncbi:membrane protease YdiL (CAAX protease family) [Conyzicola lurida]|uniref:Membrane protease YdiL (CAAX protease family) n=1 Tax=Conyzicola lurida TaxID=1172621 RepID=A0A841AL18_9MICO|nr:type II CAAX endopeptidase family protein [Conyzicola lurida]MBB5842396.1 membrane protease YdiL (CAAX protease family) [Conyzicola lurida]
MTSADATPVHYDHALYGRGGWWRGAVAIVLFVIGYFALSLVLTGVALAVDIASGAASVDNLAAGTIALTPVVMLANNLSLAALIPLSLLLQRVFFGVSPRWIFSVVGRFRWRWMARLALILVPVWVVYIGASFLLEPAGDISVDGMVLALLAVVVLTTPLQSAGEEFGARGLIQRSAGSWFRHPGVAFAVSTVVASALFTLAHFAADPWLIAYYFVFGVSASLAARGTGGLEAPVLVHVLNNVLILVPAVLLGQLDQGFDRSVGTGGPFMLVPMAVCLAAAAISTWWARRNGVAATGRPAPRVAPRRPTATVPEDSSAA